MEASALQRQRALLPRSRRLLSALSDDRLVDQVRRGNVAAFEVVYDRHYRGILSFCRHMLGSREEAEDAVQHTFTAAYTDLQSNDRDIRLKAWLYTIARNRCLSMLRARREQPAELDDQPTAGLSEEVQQRADLRELLNDLRELPDDQREALVLFELGDLSHAEVAKVIGVEPVKVKALVFQARSSLIEDREARAIPCTEIREQLATASGGALRRGPLRRHLKACDGCREYRDQVHAQRRALALLLPVVPTAGLKESILSALGLGGGAGGAGVATGGAAGGAALGGSGAAATGGGGFFASVGGLGIAKVAVATALGVGAVAGGGVAINSASGDDEGSKDRKAAKSSTAQNAAGQGGPGGSTALPTSGPGARGRSADERERARDKAKQRKRKKGRKKDKDPKAIKDPIGPNGGRGLGPRGNRGSRGGSQGSNGNGNGNAYGQGGTRGNSEGHAQGPRGNNGNGGRSQYAPPPHSNAGGNGNANGQSGTRPPLPAPAADAESRNPEPPRAPQASDGGRVLPPVVPLGE